MTLEQVRICKRYGHLINVPELAAGVDDRGFPLWHKLTVYTSEAARHEGQPVHRAMVRRRVRPGSAAPRPTAASGASTVTARRTAIVSCSSNATYPRSRP